MSIDKTNKANRGSLKVLIVEDDPFLQKILATKFAKEGFEVSGALDGEEAMRSLLKEQPSIVVLDIILPKMDGFEVLAEMRADPKIKKIPVVVLTNLSQDEDRNRVFELGAVDFLVKGNLSINEVVQKTKEAYAKYGQKRV